MLSNFFDLRKSKFQAVTLTIFATLISGTALAVDAVGGSARNTNVTVGAAWTVLTSVSFLNPTDRYCTATCSADAIRPTTVAGQYLYYFTVSDLPNPPADQGQERTLEFFNQGGFYDQSIKEITTTGGWMGSAMANPGYFKVPGIAAGMKTLYCLSRKGAAAPNLTYDDVSMTVTCTDNVLN